MTAVAEIAATTVTTTSPDSRRWAALYVLCTGMLMIVLDMTIVNVALPSIQSDLGFSDSALAWVVNGYLISFGGLLLLSGRLGDLFGRCRVFLAGLALFTAASLACGLAEGPAMLVAARFLQGVGGSMTSAVILGMIVTMFPEPGEQARAIGVYAFVASAGGAVGLLAGGVLTQSLNWHWIFFVNLPVGVATAAVAARLLPADRPATRRGGTDVMGAVTVTGALMLGVYTIVKPAAERGWTAPQTLLLAAITVALGVAFVVREHTAANPLMPMRIFRSRTVSGANLVQILSVAGMFGVFFLGALYLKRVLHYDALEIGLAFLPVAVIMGTLSMRFTEPLVTRVGACRVLIAGMVLMAVGLAWFAQAPVDGEYLTDVFPVMALLGLGAGLAFPSLMTLAMTGATPADAGLASGLVNTTAQIGGAFGLAVLATVSTGRTSDLLAGGQSADAALVGGYHVAFWIAAALMLLAVVVAAATLRGTARAQVSAEG
ncbi:MAG TPA: DHA2 family efflux MFS transporter permease subunit [Jatrophihabitans sp.]|nr:DHA2 family efflux MFS transporter permease subunit [Jatrophihabitans sp.]